MAGTAAAVAQPILRSLFGDNDPPVAIVFWDDSRVGRADGPATLRVTTPDALRRLFYAPGELGFARAYITGELTIEGDAVAAFRLLDRATPEDLQLGVRTVASVASAARRLGVLGRPLPPPPEESRLRGRRHTTARDAGAVSHHYDVSNDFYRLMLDETMTYSCARFESPEMTLEDAQRSKYDLICRKLGLRPGMRLLDVGCGWGGMAMHAARHHDADAVGVTLSALQHEWGVKAVADEGLTDRVELRVQDYREVRDERFDAVSSIGMFEHVGGARLAEYFATLYEVLPAKGRLLNHAISKPGGSVMRGRSFLHRYVFPDGELQDVATVCSAMQDAGFEVRDVESLREHYALTLRRWVANLEARWDEAVRLVGVRRARVWHLYMVGSIVNFETGGIAIHQVLGVKSAAPGRSGRPDAQGESGMPLTRHGLV